jgi:hypothetical protein
VSIERGKELFGFAIISNLGELEGDRIGAVLRGGSDSVHHTIRDHGDTHSSSGELVVRSGDDFKDWGNDISGAKGLKGYSDPTYPCRRVHQQALRQRCKSPRAASVGRSFERVEAGRAGEPFGPSWFREGSILVQ